MFRLAHLSDPHIPHAAPPRAREFVSKRVIGQVNWTRSRRGIHRRDILDAIVADLKQQMPDHIAVTGDLTNLASAAELSGALRWLQDLGGPDAVTVIPGNHDAYVPSALKRATRLWGEYMGGAASQPYPFLRLFGPIALVGCSSAVASAPFMATGRLGAAQRERLAAMLSSLAGDDIFKVVLIHHPPVAGATPHHKRLTDLHAAGPVLNRAMPGMVLHGHEHTATVAALGDLPVIGVPSASARAHGRKPAAAYAIYAIEQDAGAWKVTMTSRGLGGDGGVQELETLVLCG